MAFPIIKVVYLVVKQVSKPLSKAVAASARQNPRVERFFIKWAQVRRPASPAQRARGTRPARPDERPSRCRLAAAAGAGGGRRTIGSR